MTKLMEQVIAKVSALPPEEQEHYAVIFLNELEDEQKREGERGELVPMVLH